MSVQNLKTENWIAAMLRVAARFGKPADGKTLRQQMRWFEHLPAEQQLERLCGLLGLHLTMVSPNKLRWRQDITPVVLVMENHSVAVLEGIDGEGSARYWLSEGGDVIREGELAGLLSRTQGDVGVIGVAARGRDARIDEFVQPYEPHWFWKNFRGMGRRIAEISLASIISNVLALAGILFSMQVYDRVIPAQSEATLWVLFVGVLIAAAIEYLIRLMRTQVSDLMGKRIDLKVSAMLFARAMNIRNESRPKSTGSFISQLREIDQVRELLTSTTVGAAADLPFVILFLFIMSFIGGWLVLIPLAAIPSLLSQACWYSFLWPGWRKPAYVKGHCVMRCWSRPSKALKTSRHCRQSRIFNASGSKRMRSVRQSVISNACGGPDSRAGHRPCSS